MEFNIPNMSKARQEMLKKEMANMVIDENCRENIQREFAKNCKIIELQKQLNIESNSNARPLPHDFCKSSIPNKQKENPKKDAKGNPQQKAGRKLRARKKSVNYTEEK